MPDRTPSPIPSLTRLVVIVGPTAVGKTDVSIALARRFDAEIINVDSRLFYRGMDIGTAKPDAHQLATVPHHLIDMLDPQDPVSLAVVQDMAFAAIDDVATRGKVPMLVGGTPQYVNAIVENWRIPRVEPNPKLRAELEEVELRSPGTLIARLAAVDPAGAEKHAGNTRRIIRALEVYAATGVPISDQQGKGEPRYETLELELWRPREELHLRIDARVADQVRDGLLEEIQRLLDAGADPAAASFSSIGYRQLVPHLYGESSLEDALERIRFDTHRLVRHQETWWRKNPRLVRVDMTEPESLARIEALIERFLADSHE